MIIFVTNWKKKYIKEILMLGLLYLMVLHVIIILMGLKVHRALNYIISLKDILKIVFLL